MKKEFIVPLLPTFKSSWKEFFWTLLFFPNSRQINMSSKRKSNCTIIFRFIEFPVSRTPESDVKNTLQFCMDTPNRNKTKTNFERWVFRLLLQTASSDPLRS